MSFRLLTFILIICVIQNVFAQHFPKRKKPQFRVAFEWNYLDFTWPSPAEKQAAISRKEYIPENNLIASVEYYNDRLFLTVPRMKHGVPATLTWVPAPNISMNTAPLLEPFPSWESNRVGDCRSLQNVQSLEIDTLDILWVLDVGRTGIMEADPIAKCPPRIILYDLKSNARVLREYVFPDNVARHDNNFLNDIVIDDTDGRYAYITDNSGIDPGIIVYSYEQNRSWKMREAISMHAVPEATNFLVNGTLVSAAINLDGIALGPKWQGVDRYVYYTPVSSFHLYAISSAVLRNEQIAASDSVAQFVVDLGRKASTTDGMIMDETGVLYYGLLSDNSVAAWNVSTPFSTGQKLIARDATYIQWPDSFAIDIFGNLYLLTNRIQNFLANKVKMTEGNYRILVAHIGARSYLYGDDMMSFSTTLRSRYDDQGRDFLSSDIFTPSTSSRLYPTLPPSTNPDNMYPSSTISPEININGYSTTSRSRGLSLTEQPTIYIDGTRPPSNTQYQFGAYSTANPGDLDGLRVENNISGSTTNCVSLWMLGVVTVLYILKA